MNEQICTKFNPMTEVSSSSASAGTKMFPMKLFSSWEVEKSSPHCIPRLCSFVITRLVIKKVLEADLHSVIISIKMQGSKGMLRSNEILVQKNGFLDAELDITFSLQYSHHLKRDNNRLQIMLQRRKKYKNRTMLGYRTLAVGQVSMSHVLQHPMDREMNLHSCSKDGKSEAVARIVILSLSTQPVDQDKLKVVKDRYRYDASDEDEMQDDGDVSSNDGISDCETGEETVVPRRRTKTNSLGNAIFNQQRNLKQKFISLIKKFKVTDEVLQSAVQEIGRHDADQYVDDDMFDDVESLTDSNPDIDTISLQSVPKPKLKPFFDANKSLSILESCKSYDYDSPAMELNKKFEKQEAPSAKKNEKSMEIFGKRISEKTSSEIGQVRKASDRSTFEKDTNSKKMVDRSTAELFSASKKGDKNFENSKKLEKLSEVRPITEMAAGKKNEKTSEGVGTRKAEIRKHEFDSSAFQKLFQEQIAGITKPEQMLPECIVLMSYMEPTCDVLINKLQSSKVHVVNATSHSDVKTALTLIINKVQKFMNTMPLLMKLAIVGSEAYVHSVVRPYVKLISSRSPELVNHVKFLVIPFGNSSLCQNLAQVDPKYAKLFNDSFWRDLNTDKPEDVDADEVTSRILMYIHEASYVVQLPLAEVVLTYKDKGIDDSSQMVVPFLGEIKLKPMDIGSDDDGTSNSPPQISFLDKLKEVTSHTINATPVGQLPTSSTLSSSTQASTDVFAPAAMSSLSSEDLDLQMDYWLLPRQDHVVSGSSEKSIKKDAKVSLKTAFRSVQIFRPHISCSGSHNPHQQQLFAHTDSPSSHLYSGLSMVFITRDKKQKIMRIGKKSKELEGLRSQQIDGIGRLICTSKSQNQLLTVNIDGMDWTGIKFFQVASQWQTHFKHLPVLVFDALLDVYA